MAWNRQDDLDIVLVGACFSSDNPLHISHFLSYDSLVAMSIRSQRDEFQVDDVIGSACATLPPSLADPQRDLRASAVESRFGVALSRISIVPLTTKFIAENATKLLVIA